MTPVSDVLDGGSSSSIRGKRIVITRAKEQAEKSAALFVARGAEVVLLPTIELFPPRDPAAVADALGRLRAYAWVAFTSANGVEWTWRALEAAGLDVRAFAEAKIAAIGPGTAAALEARGARVAVMATEKRGEGLAKAMLEAMRRSGETVLLLRAQVARDVLPDTLRDAGHDVHVVSVYETRPASGSEVDAVLAELSRGAIDAITFTSASTVDNFVALVGSEGRARDLLAKTLVASIGPVTSEALSARALRVDVTAREATMAGLVASIESAITENAVGIRGKGATSD
jgi:uroporphyrinogen III methyltransferase/synthase